MKSKTMILMVVAVGCGLVASFLTSRLLADRGPVGPEMVKRLVAKKNLALGTVIKEPEKYFIEKEFPVDSAPKRGFESFDAIKNKKLTKPISEDAPITNDDVLEGEFVGQGLGEAFERELGRNVNGDRGQTDEAASC